MSIYCVIYLLNTASRQTISLDECVCMCVSSGIYDDLYYVDSIFLAKKGTSHQGPKASRSSACQSKFFEVMAVRSMKNKHTGVEKMMISTIATQAECVVFLPGRASRSVIVTMAFAQTTVLCKSFVRKTVI